MTAQKVTLYWNNICILHNYEKIYLAQMHDRLLKQGIDLSVRCFGLGYASHMAPYLVEPDAELPDMIVSTDLEVFEEHRVRELLGDLYPCSCWTQLKDIPAVNAVMRDDALLPLVIIPITLYASLPIKADATLPELIRQLRFSCGGINNSAAKTLVKIVWEHYGKDAAEELLSQALVEDMPIGAFRNVQTGKADVAAVPSIYALRADGHKSFTAIPHEGVALLPSYVAARTTISEDTAHAVCDELLSNELLDYYAQNGDLITCPQHGAKVSHYEDADRVLAVSNDFLDKLDEQEFYDLYCAHLPTAVRLE